MQRTLCFILSAKNRKATVEALVKAPNYTLNVGEISKATGISQANTSIALMELRRFKAVDYEAYATKRIYRLTINPGAIKAILAAEKQYVDNPNDGLL